MRYGPVAGVGAALLLAQACTAPPVGGAEMAQVGQTPYEKSIDAWHRARIERLRDEGGWLSLVGLHWLEPGPNTIGRADHHAISNARLPVDDAGVLTLAAGGVTFFPATGVTVEGVPPDGRLVADVDGTPTTVTIGTCQFYVIKRGERFGIRMKDPESPVRTAFTGIDRFPVDPDWRIEARYEPADGETVPVASIIGTVDDEPVAGRAIFDRAGASCRMVLMPGSAPDRLFVVFGDRTNGDSTYGGGRFLEGVLTDDGERVVLDFNRAYNPPCAFTPYATCPIPVADNRLPFAVGAGERAWGDHSHAR